MRHKNRTLSAVLFSLTMVWPVGATTIDDLRLSQTQDLPSLRATGDGVVVLGGERDLAASPGGVITVGGSFLEASLPAIGGWATVSWDGADGNAEVLHSTGLAGVDLVAGDTDAVRLLVAEAAGGVEIDITIWSDDNRSALFTLIPADVGETTAYLLPFSRFITTDEGADLEQVGAVTMTMRATGPARLRLAGPIEAIRRAVAIDAIKSDLDQPAHSGGSELGTTPVAPGSGFTLSYTITNTGDENATGVQLDDTLDSNLVEGAARSTPLAFDDAYPSCGNARLTVDGSPGLAGLVDNDLDLDMEVLTVVDPPIGAPSATTQGGLVTIIDSAAGLFNYDPPAGHVGDDTFTYTIEDSDGNQSTAVATISLSGLVWFADSNHGGSTNQGTEANPFLSLDPLNGSGGVGDVDGPGDIIFLYAGSEFSSGIGLEDNQKLIGGPAGLSECVVTPIPGSGIHPRIGDAGGPAVGVATGNTITSVELVTSAGGTGLAGIGFGALAGDDITIDGTGKAVDLDNGTPSVTFNDLSSGDSPSQGIDLSNLGPGSSLAVTGTTTVDNAAGEGVRINTVGAGSNLTFGQVDVTNRNNTGILVSGASGNLAFGDVTIANPNGAGGYGIRISGSPGAATIASANISNTMQTIATNDAGADGVPDNDGDGDGIFLSNNLGSFTLNGGTIQNIADDGIDLRNSANVSLSSVNIQDVGLASTNAPTVAPGGISAINLMGANLLFNCSIERFQTFAGSRGMDVLNVDTDVTGLTLDSTFFWTSGPSGGDGFRFIGRGAVNGALTIQDCGADEMAASGFEVVVGDNDGSGSVALTFIDTSLTNAVDPGGHGGLNIITRGTARLDPLDITGCVFSNLGYVSTSTFGLVNLDMGESSGVVGTFESNTINRNDPGGTNGMVGFRVHADSSAPDYVDTLDLTFDGNTINGTAREAIRIDVLGSALASFGSAPAALDLFDNVIGQSHWVAETDGSGIVLRVNDDGQSKTVNTRLSNNQVRNLTNPSTDETTLIQVEDNSTVNLNVSGNTFQGDFAGPDPLAIEFAVEASEISNVCLVFDNNWLLQSGGPGEYLFNDNTSGSFLYTEAGNTGTLLTLGSPTLVPGLSCPVP